MSRAHDDGARDTWVSRHVESEIGDSGDCGVCVRMRGGPGSIRPVARGTTGRSNISDSTSFYNFMIHLDDRTGGQLPWVDAERPRRATRGPAAPPVRADCRTNTSGFRQHKSNGRVTQSNGPITRPHAPSRPKSLARPRWRAQTGAAARSTPPAPRGCPRRRVPAHPYGPKGAKGS